jgi:dTDP-4-amino-4,6-dideoxygalactose transaminase
MHYAGYMCDMPAILAIAEEHDLAVIEDAAHAPGAELDGRRAGTWGEVGCFSFFSNKNLVTGEGGMIVTDQDDLAEKIRLMRSHGMTSLTWDRHKGHAHSYDVVSLGYNYRIDEIRSALGLVQLHKLEDNNARRRTIGEHYRQEFGKLEYLSLPYNAHAGVSSAHIFPVLLDNGIDRGGFIEAMHAQGIQTSIHYPPVHQFTYYRQSGNSIDLPLTEEMASREVTLPLYPSMSDEQLGLVIDAVKLALKDSAN